MHDMYHACHLVCDLVDVHVHGMCSEHSHGYTYYGYTYYGVTLAGVIAKLTSGVPTWSGSGLGLGLG